MAERARLSPTAVLLIAGGIAIAAGIAFMTVGARGSWSFVLPFRGTKLLAICLVGYAIAVSTVLFQTVSGNRILTPSIMGFDALYMLIQTSMVFTLGGLGYAMFPLELRFAGEVAAMIGFSTLLFHFLFMGSARSLHLTVLAGIVFGVLFRSVSNLMQRLIEPNEFNVLQDAMFASFNTFDQTLLWISAAAIAAVTTILWRIRHTFDVLALGPEIATNLGLNYRRIVMLILSLIAVLVSVSTALVGPVTFFGLLVANLAYLVAGTHKHSVVLPVATLLAITALVGGQVILERVFGFDSALSIIIEFVGGILFLALLLRGAGR